MLGKIFRKTGFSLLEMTVSLGIIAVIMVMLTNILIISLTVSSKTAARGLVREETSNVLANIKRDIRNAQLIEECLGENETASCEGTLALSGSFRWGMCDNDNGTKAICKYDKDGNIEEKTPDSININKLLFDVGFDKTQDKRTVLVTIVSSYKIEGLNVQNIIQQTSVSTRNYPNLGSTVGVPPAVTPPAIPPAVPPGTPSHVIPPPGTPPASIPNPPGPPRIPPPPSSF